MANNSIRVGSWELFGLLILASALVHFLFVFFLPAGELLHTSLFETSFEPTHRSIPLVFEFVEAGDEVAELAKKEEQLQEEEKQQEEPEKKLPLFVDTADSPVDEEVTEEAETNMIGEKGTLARDTAPDEGPLKEEPRLEGDTDMPAIGGPPGEGPGYEGGFAEMLAGVVDITESDTSQTEEFTPPEESEKSEEPAQPGEAGNAASTIEGEEVAETPPEENPSETTSSDETLPLEPNEAAKPNQLVAQETPTPQEMLAAQETPTAETKGKEIKGIETAEKGPHTEERLGLTEENLVKTEDGLIPIQEKPKELAYVPPMEPRGQKQDAKKTEKENRKTAARRAGRPKVAISFNAKTLGGTIEPLYDNEDGNAPRDGMEAFSVRKDEYAPYYRHIRDRVSWYWVLKYGTRAEINLETNTNSPIIISFKVYPGGEIKAVKIVDAAGNNLLASYISNSIAETRLNKFPSYVEEEFIDVRFNFYFF